MVARCGRYSDLWTPAGCGVGCRLGMTGIDMDCHAHKIGTVGHAQPACSGSRLFEGGESLPWWLSVTLTLGRQTATFGAATHSSHHSRDLP